jgi:hypothetical protein
MVQPGSAERSATSPGAWCVRPAVAPSYEAPVLTRMADVLMAQIELDLLVGALDEEGRVGVDDGSQPLQGEAGGDADHQLLANADVEEPFVAWELGGADLGQHDRGARIVQQRVGGQLVEALAHRRHRRTSATTTFGCAPVAASARSSAS